MVNYLVLKRLNIYSLVVVVNPDFLIIDLLIDIIQLNRYVVFI